MNLDNLKPAWNKFKALNSMQQFNHGQILLMLESPESIGVNRTYRYMMGAIMFIVLTVCCQGG
jgi:hypothetical protein